MGWGTNDRRTRRSKRGDHGPANPAYGEKMQSRNLEDVVAADTIQQPARAPHRRSKQKTLKKSCD
jgi:hypothetical protein